jgi:hypothetical protein
MTTTEVQKIVCPACSALLDVRDNYCRCCGQPTFDQIADFPVPPRSTAVVRSPAGVAISDPAVPAETLASRVLVLMMLFLGLGPLALPMLWRSREFSSRWKAILTGTVIGLTALLLLLLWFVVAKLLEPLSQLKLPEGF